MLRILSFCIICASIFLFPWWVGAFLAVVCAFYFDFYVELIVFAIIIDALYGYGGGADRFIFTAIGVILFLLIPIVKSKLYVRS
ncbi:hypothetical protein EPO17_03090 [Patescibacteria group bacterium]|nr:MAG: hypothetical protein EPO17_03090 [Patescibacteria group bacterium]